MLSLVPETQPPLYCPPLFCISCAGTEENLRIPLSKTHSAAKKAPKAGPHSGQPTAARLVQSSLCPPPHNLKCLARASLSQPRPSEALRATTTNPQTPKKTTPSPRHLLISTSDLANVPLPPCFTLIFFYLSRLHPFAHSALLLRDLSRTKNLLIPTSSVRCDRSKNNPSSGLERMRIGSPPSQYGLAISSRFSASPAGVSAVYQASQPPSRRGVDGVSCPFSLHATKKAAGKNNHQAFCLISYFLCCSAPQDQIRPQNKPVNDRSRPNDNPLLDQTNRRPATERHVSRNSASRWPFLCGGKQPTLACVCVRAS